MPLNVDIALNGQRLEALRIARLEDFRGPDAEHVYRVTVGKDEATFRHRYSDGARECVRRALEALDRV